MRIYIAALCATLTLPAWAGPQQDQPIPPAQPEFVLPESPGTRYLRKLSDQEKEALGIKDKIILDFVQKPPAKQTTSKIASPPTTSADRSSTAPSETNSPIEEIVVYGEKEEKKPSPKMILRAKLDKERPKTPQEITQQALCFIGFCFVDPSKELSVADRNEHRAKHPPSFANMR